MSSYELQPGAVIRLIQPVNVQAWDDALSTSGPLTLEAGTRVFLAMDYWHGDETVFAGAEPDRNIPEGKGRPVTIEVAALERRYEVIQNTLWAPEDLDLTRFSHRLLLMRALERYTRWLSILPEAIQADAEVLLGKLRHGRISCEEYIAQFAPVLKEVADIQMKGNIAR